MTKLSFFCNKKVHFIAGRNFILETHFHADFVSGHLDLPRKTGVAIEEISANDFAKLYSSKGEIHLLDARKESEYNSQHIVGAVNFPLDFINENMSMLDRSKKYYVHCAGGYRSVITASILISRGFTDVVNIKGGFNALNTTNLPKTEFAVQKTLL
jgi:hydroxyacylglutathione hydrolase